MCKNNNICRVYVVSIVFYSANWRDLRGGIVRVIKIMGPVMDYPAGAVLVVDEDAVPGPGDCVELDVGIADFVVMAEWLPGMKVRGVVAYLVSD